MTPKRSEEIEPNKPCQKATTRRSALQSRTKATSHPADATTRRTPTDLDPRLHVNRALAIIKICTYHQDIAVPTYVNTYPICDLAICGSDGYPASAYPVSMASFTD